ncbi:MAG: Trk system potassium transporter TrkA [Oscillospiraceae bacterium]|nr:Trk system potassium transporter TrkA [Oscillospiraceae bacterium]
MNIAIVGCGKIGRTLLDSLTREGHNVTAVDRSAETVGEISNVYDVIGVIGSATDPDTLRQAGVEKAQLFVAVTGSDETNMLACFLAKRLGAEHTVARIRNPEYNAASQSFLRKHLELSLTVNPDLLAAQELYHVLRLPSAVKVEYFSQRRFEMIELRLKPDSALDGLTLREMRKEYPAEYLLGTVRRDEDVFIPGGDFVLRGGDHIGVIATPAEIQKLLKKLGRLKKQAQSVMLLGASKTAYYLTRQLLASGTEVTVIEKDPVRCADMSERFPEATVICGDGARQEILLEEGILSIDAFVSLTGFDEENILISIFADAQRVPKVITKINRAELSAMAEKLGLDSIVSPRRIVADVLVRYARALENSQGSSVETLYKLMDGKVEALEFSVLDDFRYANTPLRELPFKKNVLIGGILRGRRAIMPSGDEVLLPGDKVVVLAAAQRLRDLADVIG